MRLALLVGAFLLPSLTAGCTDCCSVYMGVAALASVAGEWSPEALEQAFEGYAAIRFDGSDAFLEGPGFTGVLDVLVNSPESSRPRFEGDIRVVFPAESAAMTPADAQRRAESEWPAHKATFDEVVRRLEQAGLHVTSGPGVVCDCAES